MHSHTTTTPSSAPIGVDIRRLSWIRRLATDYAFQYANLARFFAGDPATPQAWAEAIRRRSAGAERRDDLARVITAQQQRRGAPPAALAATTRLADPDTVVIITGQQAGVFGGPLFTLLKAVTAMKLAERIGGEHDVTVVPVFWIDAEDHDWAEVSGCTVLDGEMAPHTIKLTDLPGAGHLPVGRLVLDDHVGHTIDALQAILPHTEFTASVIDDARKAYRPGATVSESFGQFLETLLGPYGLVVYDSSDPAAKPLARAVFAQELSQPGTTAELAARAGQALVEAGYHAQVTPHEGAVSLFYLNGGRESIRVQGDQALIGEHSVPFASLAEEIATAPHRFSPNVLLRPIVQDTIFPTICYVAGPNELAYLGQLRDVYAHFGVPMPLIYQRATATIADSATLRFLSKYDMAIESLQPQGEAVLNHLLQEQLPPTVEQALRSVADMIDERMAALAAAVPQIDPTLEGTVKSTLGRMQHDLHTLHNKVIQAAKRRHETLRRQFQRAQALTFPNGHPQERELGFIWFSNRYGPALVDRLLEDLPLEMGRHWVLTL